jgi:hypothetical protein
VFGVPMVHRISGVRCITSALLWYRIKGNGASHFAMALWLRAGAKK